MFTVKKLQLSIFSFKRACSGIYEEDDEWMEWMREGGSGPVGRVSRSKQRVLYRN